MNIFALSEDPYEASLYHVDKHVVKMILESCQLLSTAHRFLDGQVTVIDTVTKTGKHRKKKVYKLDDHQLDSKLYNATHINHPSAIWVRKSPQNYRWLHRLVTELSAEYTYRYDKIHKCTWSLLIDTLERVPDNIGSEKFTLPTPAMPEYCIIEGDVVQSYRNYYNREKRDLFSWKNREIPSWIKG